MTNSVEQVYQNALLADAAYINFDNEHLNDDGTIKDTPDTEKLFLDRGFTTEQFNKFIEKYQIYKPEGGEAAHQQNSLTNFGFAATIFEETTTHKLTVAFRGTEGDDAWNAPADLFEDIILALGLSSTVGEFLQDGEIDDFLEDSGLASDGKATAGNINNVNFVGHSLGGHLTLMAAYKFPDLIDKAYTFNGAGTTLLDTFYLDYIKPFLGPLFDQNVLDASRVSNFYSEPGFEVTANDNLFRRSDQGTRDGLFIEKQGTNESMDNHSMSFMVDALSVHRILALLGNDLDLKTTDDMLWQAHNRAVEVRTKEGIPDGSNPASAATSLDLVMKHLATTLGGVFANLNTTNDAQKFYNELTAAPYFTLVEMSSLGDITDIAANDTSETGTALRYALLTGASFVVIPHAGYKGGIFDPEKNRQ